MTTPSVEYGVLSPMLILFGVAVAGVLVEAFLPRRSRYPVQMTLALGGLLAALAALVGVYRNLGPTGQAAAVGAVAVDRPALFLQGTVLMVAVLGVLLIGERRSRAGGLDGFTAQASTVPGSATEQVATKAAVAQTEVFPLTMFAVVGMVLFPAANDLLTMFIALEVLSLPLYLMCGLSRYRRLLSQEASLKYFLLGAFSSAFFLYGMALLYGYAGTLSITGIAAALRTGTVSGAPSTTLALLGAALVMVALLFKVGAVPFHAWVPDVYQGAPTPITAFMAAATKIAAFGALMRLLYVAVPELKDQWRPVLWAVAILSMAVGTVAAVTQRDVKRMLAYSAVAHTGFILTGVIAGNASGVSGTLFYLAAYGFSTVGAFAVVSVVRGADGAEETALERWAGLGRRYPVAGVVFSLFLLAFAGIPLTSGFVSKFAVFKAAGEGGAIPLVVVGVLASAIAAYFYVRVIVLMFFTDPPDDAPEFAPPGFLSVATIGVTAVITVALGALPQPLLDLAGAASEFLTS
ncbi:NADH-quinone oxidoreductase subunit NuoN [Mycolicibacterium sp.]|uniref:NADH-quinone oxidoreductase subunit NuoN n=1 Tax=Mycolicibacterium sp. TaxID=2320850 RepID=UPI0028A7028A|nr:NADH-quinone oxidoreductase subunit NuoN [Mycolicibacterium sp.]